MTTNVQNTRPSSHTGDPAVVETIPTPITAPVGGVAVYDREVDTKPSVSLVDDRVPAEAGSSGSMMTWIISALVLIVLLYLLINYVF